MSNAHDFTDAKGRCIRLEGDDASIRAFHEESRIGHMDFEEYEGYLIMAFVDVKPAYQHAGIGTAMMVFANDCIGDFLVPGRTWNERRDDGFHTSIEGRALINSCMRKGILKEQQYADYEEWTESPGDSGE